MEFLKPLEHKFKAAVFNLLKLFLEQGKKELIPIDGSKLQKVLFLRPDKLGDMIISFPVFESFKRNFPNLKISILGSPRSRMIIKNDKRFEKQYMYLKNPLKDLKTIREIRKAKYDCVVDLIREDSVTSLFLSQLTASGKPRVGLAKVKYDAYYDFNDPFTADNKNHIITNTLKVLDAFGIDSSKESGYAEPFLTVEELEFAKRTIEQLKKSTSTKIIGYNLSAGMPNRVWAKEKSVELVRQLLEHNSQYEILLFTTPDERERAVYVQNELQSRLHIIPENLSLTSVAALIKQLDLLITPDTSLVHIARSFNLPVVGLFSSFMKNYLLWRPYDQEVGSVIAESKDNIFDITVTQVMDVFKSVIEQKRSLSS